MLGWIVRGLRTGVRTTRYPSGTDVLRLRTVPHIDVAYLVPQDCARLAEVCPTGALSCDESADSVKLVLDYGKCVFCGLCAEALPGAVSMSSEFELAVRDRRDLRTTYVFRRELDER